MKVYLVIETYHESDYNDDSRTYIYGVFSSRKKAEEIVAKVKDHMGDSEYKIEELVLDETTEDYDFAMSM